MKFSNFHSSFQTVLDIKKPDHNEQSGKIKYLSISRSK